MVGFVFLLVSCSNEEVMDDNNIKNTLIGNWQGMIETPDMPLNVLVTFEEVDEDDLAGKISIPMQGLTDFPLSDLKVSDDDIRFDMDLPGQFIRFVGDLEHEERIEGTFTQQGQSFPFHLQKGELSSEEDEEANLVSVETDDGTLQGELLEPNKDGPSPVVLIIPGSGPTDRHGNSPGVGQNNSLKLLAEALADKGIASVRYSKRGALENSDAIVPEEDMRFDDFIQDAVYWLEMLKEDDRFNEVGIIGHSQGALVGKLASLDVEVDAIISIAGAGRTIDDVLREQLAVQLPEHLMIEADKILNQIAEGNVVEDVSTELQSTFRPGVQPFLGSWMAYDPSEIMTKVDANTLIVQGEHDLQVTKEDAEQLAKAKPEAEWVVIDGMNHVLKDSPEDRMGNLATYQDPTSPLAEGLVEEIILFLQEPFNLE